MKTIPFSPSRISRFGACVVAALGLCMGVASAKSPIVTLPLAAQDFGPGNTIDVKSKGLLADSVSYKYTLKGTCVGTGGLSSIKKGTPISAVFTGVKMSGKYPNPTLAKEFVVIDDTFTGVQTIKGIGKVTLSAHVTGGKLASGQVYFKVTNVTVTAAKPLPAGTIRLEKGAQFVITAAPVIQFKRISTNVPESAGQVEVLITKVGRGKVSVLLNTADGTADSGDYTPIVNRKLVFPAKTSSLTVPIAILPNTVKDGFRTFTVTLGNPTGGAVLGTKSVHTIGVQDDD